MSKKRRSIDATIANKGIQADVVNAGALAVGKGATAIVNQGMSSPSDDVLRIFNQLRLRANDLTDEENKQDANTAISGLEQEAKKGDQAKEKVVNKWFNFLLETTPDVWEIAVSAFINPIQGISLVFKKVAERAKAEREAKEKSN